MAAEYGIFNGLTSEQRHRVYQFAQRKTYDQGSKIIQDGSEADRFFIIREGCVTIRKNGITLATINKGMHFGLMALIDGSSRSADALAETRTTLEIIPYKFIHNSANSDIYQQILNNQLVLQQNQLRLMNDMTVAEVQKKAIDTSSPPSLPKESTYYESLLKEIHHRVKNNLQTVSSMLFLQSRHIKDPDAKEAILSSQQRVESMALIHKSLYQRENLAELEMKSYITQLARSLISAYQSYEHKINVQIDMEEVELTIEKAIPIGLVINELITNSLKYAFKGKASGTISLKLIKNGNEGYKLEVADNGSGKLSNRVGFGTQLIKTLVNQIEGRINENSTDGYRFSLEF